MVANERFMDIFVLMLMRPIKNQFFNSVAFLAMTFCVFNTWAQQKAPTVYTVTADYITECEMGTGPCNPFVVTRGDYKDSLVLQLPSGGTSSSVHFFCDGNDSINSGNASKLSPVYLHDMKRAGEGPLHLNLTGIKDGEYICHMLACNLGGIFKVRIHTKFDCNTNTFNGQPIYNSIEILSNEYKGPDVKELNRFLIENVKYNFSETTNNTIPQSRFFNRFYVDTTGRVVKVCVFSVKGKERVPEIETNLQKQLDEKPIFFSPAQKNGEPVNIYFSMPLTICFK